MTTLHILSLPHTQTTVDYISCAYTSKARNFSTMMKSIGYKTILYASEDNDADCDELVTIASLEEQERWFGEFDYHKNFYPITWGVDDEHWVKSNENAINEIQKRIQPGDIICLIAGWCQKQVADAFPNFPSVEYGIGYNGVFADYKVYESYSHMHYVHGEMKNDNGRHYECVIPNYFNPDDFYIKNKVEKSSKYTPPEDYYVFLGRFIERKGVEIAVEATRKLGAKLIMAGQGCTVSYDGKVFSGDDVQVSGDHLKHIGHVDLKQRAKLLAGAKATFMPTTYLEPFGGVAIESLMSGTPVIASDFGAFTETIPHGTVGYRFRTVGEAAYFASPEMLKELQTPQQIREYAIKNYSMDVIKYKYDDYFQKIVNLYNGKSDFYGDWHGRADRYTHY